MQISHTNGHDISNYLNNHGRLIQSFIGITVIEKKGTEEKSEIYFWVATVILHICVHDPFNLLKRLTIKWLSQATLKSYQINKFLILPLNIFFFMGPSNTYAYLLKNAISFCFKLYNMYFILEYIFLNLNESLKGCFHQFL